MFGMLYYVDECVRYGILLYASYSFWGSFEPIQFDECNTVFPPELVDEIDLTG